MKQIIRDIEKCFECPFVEWDYDRFGNSYNYCSYVDVNNVNDTNDKIKIIEDINSIPEWCPLPDKKD